MRRKWIIILAMILMLCAFGLAACDSPSGDSGLKDDIERPDEVEVSELHYYEYAMIVSWQDKTADLNKKYDSSSNDWQYVFKLNDGEEKPVDDYLIDANTLNDMHFSSEDMIFDLSKLTESGHHDFTVILKGGEGMSDQTLGTEEVMLPHYEFETELLRDEGGIYGLSITGIGNVTDTDLIISNPYPVDKGEGGTTYIPVHKIAAEAFRGNTALTSLTIKEMQRFGGCPNIEIQTGAFQDCTGLKTLEIAANAGTNAFKGCTGLTDINTYSVSAGAFQGCTSLENAIVGTVSASTAFQGCTALKTISANSVAAHAFTTCTNLERAFVQGYVGQQAFYNLTNLKEVNIYGIISTWEGNSLDDYSYIGAGAFANCTSLTDVTLSSVTVLRSGAFANTGIASITLPSELRVMENQVFEACFELTSINIPFGVEEIGAGAFLMCEKLTAITVNGNNSDYSAADGVLFNKDKTELICYPAGKSGSSYTVPSSVTDIGTAVFSYSAHLTSVQIPASVESINPFAFANVYSPLFESGGISEIIVSADNAKYSSEDGVLFNKDKTELACYPSGKTATTYTIPATVTSIGIGAFYYNTSLVSMTIPATVTVINDMAFYYNTSLESVTIESGTEIIYAQAFEGCSALTQITIPSSVTAIHELAFYGCSALAAITIPSSVTTLAPNALYKWTAEQTIFVPFANAAALAAAWDAYWFTMFEYYSDAVIAYQSQS